VIGERQVLRHHRGRKTQACSQVHGVPHGVVTVRVEIKQRAERPLLLARWLLAPSRSRLPAALAWSRPTGTAPLHLRGSVTMPLLVIVRKRAMMSS
jgi:hypothetical protein